MLFFSRRFLSTPASRSRAIGLAAQNRSALRKAAEERRRLQYRETRRGQELLGSIILAFGGSCLTFQHADFVLATMRDLDVVGSALMACGFAIAAAPSLRDIWRYREGTVRQMHALQMQLNSTQRSLEDFTREIHHSNTKAHGDDFEDKQRKYGPTRVIHATLPTSLTDPEKLSNALTLLGFPPEIILPIRPRRTNQSTQAQAFIQFATLETASRFLQGLRAFHLLENQDQGMRASYSSKNEIQFLTSTVQETGAWIRPDLALYPPFLTKGEEDTHDSMTSSFSIQEDFSSDSEHNDHAASRKRHISTSP